MQLFMTHRAALGALQRRGILRPSLLLCVSFIACVLALGGAPSLAAQSVDEQLREMRREILDLQGEVKALKEILQKTPIGLAREREAPVEGPSPSRPDPPGSPAVPRASQEATEQQAAPSAEAVVPLLQSQIAEQAQTKVESNSRQPVKIFGTIVAGTFINSGEVNWLDNPNTVLPKPGASLPAGSFSMSLRQSQLGAIVNGPAFGAWRASGLVAVDFFGGVTNFQTGEVMPLPRLLYGFARLERRNTAIEIGQDQMILAPGNPTSVAALAFPDLYRAGNLYLRAPQVRVEQTFSAGNTGQFEAVAGILAPVAGDLSGAYQFAPPNLSGERSRRPAVQGRFGWRSRSIEGRRFEIGVSAHDGSVRVASGSMPSWAAALDFDAQGRWLELGGEWFVGRNLAGFGGAIGQFAKSTGGFAEIRLKASERLRFNSGLGTDRLFDLRAFPAPLHRNSAVFVNAIYRFTPELEGSIEYRWLSTVPASGTPLRNNYLDFVVAYSF